MNESVCVSIEEGLIKGQACTGRKGVKFYSFQGIPYAEPPVGKLRFKAPKPVKQWKGILDATQEPPQCYQRHMIRFQEVEGQEDCLHLNVYTPQICTFYKTYAVMVWIHGGVFVCGSSRTELCGPDFLMTQNIVLVTFNYRVGMLGFMSLEDPRVKVPGNAGLKDQVLVLKWIQRNISKFGGNKRNVTLFGQSSGAACAHLHMLSPMSQGLFHKVILQSGCALNPWVTGILGTGRLLANVLGIKGNDEKILEKLKLVPVEKIFEAQEVLSNDNSVDVEWLCSPVIEKGTRQPAFLPDEPINIIRSGNYAKIPMIIGYSSREGMYWDLYNRLMTGKSELITDFNQVVPNNIKAKKGSLLHQTIAEQIKIFYYGSRVQESRIGRDPRLKRMDPLYQLMTDVFFLRGIYMTARNHVEMSPKTPIFYYRFSIETDLNIFKNVYSITHRKKYPGAIHGDDLGYFFHTFLTPDIQYGAIEDVTINKILRMWTTFARTGNPNSLFAYNTSVYWNPVEPQQFYYLEIDDELETSFCPDVDRMYFWDKIYGNDKRTQYL